MAISLEEPSPEVQQIRSMVQSGDHAGAAAMLSALMRGDDKTEFARVLGEYSRTYGLGEATSLFDGLSDNALRRLRSEAKKANSGKIFFPNPGPQTFGYYSEADELFYGGAAGGGKSALLCGLALNEHFHSRLFRRQMAQTEGLISEFRNQLGDLEGLRRSPYPVIERKIGDRDIRVEFAGVANDEDKTKYAGRAVDLMGFDEITEFTEQLYRFLIIWNRPAPGDRRKNQRFRVVATGNPPENDEGMWVIRYWAPWLDPDHPNPAKPGELRWFTSIRDEEVEVAGPEPIETGVVHDNGVREVVYPRSRTFIPAKLEDNPELERSGYAGVLDGLPEELRDKYRHGIFVARHKDASNQVIPTAWVDRAIERGRDAVRRGAYDQAMKVLAVDPSLGGKDEAVFAPRYGEHVLGPLSCYPGREFLGPDGEPLPRLLIEKMSGLRRDGATVNLDSIGIGAAVLMHCQNNNIPVFPIIASRNANATTADGMLTIKNVRTLLYWRMRELLDPDHGSGQGAPSQICLPNDPILRQDLTAVRYQIDRGVITLEDKDITRNRLGRSTDRGDAGCMAFMGGPAPARRTGSRVLGRVRRGHDAFRDRRRRGNGQSF